MSNSGQTEKTNLKIDGERISLRILTPEMVSDAYVGWLNDPRVNRFLETRFVPQTHETCNRFVEAMYLNQSEYLFGIFLKTNDQHIGNIKLGSINWHHLNGQISLFIGEISQWGKGYATDAIHTISKWGYSQIGLQKLEAGCYDENIASLKAFLRVGFQVEGFFRQRIIDQGRRHGSFWLGALPGEIK